MSQASNKSTPTLDQRRASHAWHAVQSILKSQRPGSDGAKKYGGQAKKLPMRIMSAGLGQALAFLRAKDYAPDLLAAISDWVLVKRQHRDDATGPPLARDDKELDRKLLEAIIKGDSNFLRRATDETLAYLLWLNRFAEAEGLTDEGGND